MEINRIQTILFVKDQDRSCRFYEAIFRKKADLNVPGMTEFNFTPTFKLGLMPNKGIAKILENQMPDPENGNGIPRCELYFNVGDVEKEFDNALKNGATLISPILDRDWGDRVCYFSDYDGHILAFAKQII